MLIITDTCCGDGKSVCVQCPSEKLDDFKKFQTELENEYRRHFLRHLM